MGNASTTVNDITSNITNTALSSCGGTTSSQTVIISNSEYIAPPGCDAGFEINQTTTVDATCYLSSLQQTAASQAASMTSEMQAALGLNIDTDVSVFETNISNITQQTCEGASNDQLAVVDNFRCNACGFVVTQNGTENQNCQINATIGVINDQAAEYISLQSGWDPLASIGAWIESISTGSMVVSVGCSIVCLGVFIGLIVLLVKMMSKKPDKSYDSDIALEDELTAESISFNQEGGNSNVYNTIRRNKVLVGIAIVAALLLISLCMSAAFKPREITVQ